MRRSNFVPASLVAPWRRAAATPRPRGIFPGDESRQRRGRDVISTQATIKYFGNYWVSGDGSCFSYNPAFLGAGQTAADDKNAEYDKTEDRLWTLNIKSTRGPLKLVGRGGAQGCPDGDEYFVPGCDNQDCKGILISGAVPGNLRAAGAPQPPGARLQSAPPHAGARKRTRQTASQTTRPSASSTSLRPRTSWTSSVQTVLKRAVAKRGRPLLHRDVP